MILSETNRNIYEVTEGTEEEGDVFENQKEKEDVEHVGYKVSKVERKE